MLATIVFLSYNRPEKLFQAVHSAVQNTEIPLEVIIHDDGSDASIQQSVFTGTRELGSTHIFNRPGHNMGVGNAVRRGFSIANGDYYIKADQDLIFHPGWLESAIKVHEQDVNVGMTGLFKYHVEPCRWQDKQIDVPTVGDYHYVEDFVSSLFVIPSDVYWQCGRFPKSQSNYAEDVGYKNRLKEYGFRLALTNLDYVSNVGFGFGPDLSTIVTSIDPGNYQTRPINEEPWTL